MQAPLQSDKARVAELESKHPEFPRLFESLFSQGGDR